MSNLIPLLAVIALVAVASWLYRRRNGVARTVDVTFTRAQLVELGLPLRGRALLLFTAPGCAPCVTAKAVLDDTAQRHGVAVVVADVTHHHAIAAAEHVYRAPTVFIVDERGHAISRISGVPRDGELDEVLKSADRIAA